MHADTAFSARVRDAVAAVPAPDAPVHAILARAARPETLSRRSFSPFAKFAVAVAAAVVLAALTLPVAMPGLAQTIESRIAALLGWTPPPPAPRSVTDAMKARIVTLDEARAAVHFDLVPPSGLPDDVVASKIYAAPTGVYDNATRTWHVGDVSLSFVYHRTGNRYFTVNVGRFDSREGAPPKYVYDADLVGADGLPKRFANFAWRNGDQVTSIVAEQIGEAQIASIRAAMGGTPLRPASPGGLRSGKIVRMRVVPGP